MLLWLFFGLVGTPLGIKEVEYFLNFEELRAEVVVDYDESEDVAAVDEDDEAVE
jgi:hypothetical protein